MAQRWTRQASQGNPLTSLEEASAVIVDTASPRVTGLPTGEVTLNDVRGVGDAGRGRDDPDRSVHSGRLSVHGNDVTLTGIDLRGPVEIGGTDVRVEDPRP